jgi:hypothetical protein
VGVVLEGISEEVVSDLQVAAVLPMGFERLTLYFTDRRIIVSHRGKVGAGSVPTTAFMFGPLGSAVSGLFGRGKNKAGPSKSESRYPSPGRILASDKDNFYILFEEVVGVELTKTETTNRIVIHAKDDKYNFTSRTRFDQIISLLEKPLGAKLTVIR